MSIEETWHNAGKSDDDLVSLLNSDACLRQPSHNPLLRIKKNLRYNFLGAACIGVLYVIIILHFHLWQVQLAIGINLAFTVWCLYTTWLQYQQLDAVVSTMPLLEELKRHSWSMKQWMRIQQQVALFVYPVSAAGGFLVGGVLASGKSVEALFSKPIMLPAMLIAVAVMVPLGYLLARKLFRASFGRHLDQIQEHIARLEEK